MTLLAPVKIIHRYIFREMVVPFLLSLVVLTFIFLISRILQLTELMVNRGVSLLDIIKLFIFATPYFFVFTIPMAVLFAITLAFIRLSADNEITALKAAGVSLYQILPPVLALVACAFGFTMFVSTYLLPRGNAALTNHLFAMASSRAEVVIRERIFIDEFSDMVLYVESVDPKSRQFHRVFVADQRDQQTSTVILARRGALLRDQEQKILVLRLYQGVIDRLSAGRQLTETINFATYDLRIDVKHLSSQRQSQERHREELKMDELWRKLDELPRGTVQYYLYFMVFHERLSIPFACIFLGLLGVPLGIQSRVRRASSGLILAVGAFLSYYLLYMAAKGLGETGLYPPLLGLWLPNIIFGLLTLYLIVQTVRERPWFLGRLHDRLAVRIRARFGRRG